MDLQDNFNLVYHVNHVKKTRIILVSIREEIMTVNFGYKNPIIPGFYPDPSICRVGEDYYLVTSTFEFFPGVPVFHSKDLINWTQIGHCLTRKSQLLLDKAGWSAGIYAPTIRYHNGLFYMVTTNVSIGQHLIVTAVDPAGEWSEPMLLTHGAIDPSLFFDDDGKVYFTSNGNGGILQSELDLNTGKFISEMRVIWSGTGGCYPEAPHLYKINGRYYLMIAEGGTEYGHMETIARSDSPWGPFEPCPHNPILSHRSLACPIRCTGHADLFEDHTGQWWVVFLGVRPAAAYPPRYHLGRETFLASVTWDENGWPVVYGGKHVELDMQVPTLPQFLISPVPARDDFDSEKLAMQWNFLRNPNDQDWSLTERPGYLRLNGSEITLDVCDSPAFVGRRLQHFDAAIRTKIDFNPMADGDEAGITIYMNPTHHYEIAVRLNTEGKRSVFVRRRIGSLIAVVAETAIPDGPIILGMNTMQFNVEFGYEDADGTFIAMANGETCYLATEVAGGFTGAYIAMYATGNGTRSNTPADFDWFDYGV
jgi:alpha-N-arabinofuranosidase